MIYKHTDSGHVFKPSPPSAPSLSIETVAVSALIKFYLTEAKRAGMDTAAMAILREIVERAEAETQSQAEAGIVPQSTVQNSLKLLMPHGIMRKASTPTLSRFLTILSMRSFSKICQGRTMFVECPLSWRIC